MGEDYDPKALRLARQAAPGERVLWAGRPGRRFVPTFELVRGLVLLGATVAVFAHEAITDPFHIDHWWQFAPLLILTVPLFILATAIIDIRRRGREVYAVTERRVLILAPEGWVRHAVGLEAFTTFRRVGRTIHLGGEDEAVEQGKGDLDGGLARFDALPKLERLRDAERVMTTIRLAAEAL